TYRILHRLPFNLKKIRREIKSFGAAHIVPQAFAVSAPELSRQLKLKPGGTHFLFLTRFRGRSLVFWALPHN
ncbi:MAG: hypothetical protein NZ534_09775, partial [Bacteroidia bacterium]|nr:hypothetical protein [Bacteroidia bacterium]